MLDAVQTVKPLKANVNTENNIYDNAKPEKKNYCITVPTGT